MNKDQLKGRVEEAKGRVKEAAGKLVGNERLVAKGRAAKLAGRTRASFGEVKRKIGNALCKAIDR